MKIFFLGSVSADKEFAEEYYKKIVASLEALGHRVEYDLMTFNPKEVLELDQEDYDDFYKKMTRSIKASDFVLAEVSHPTIKIGYGIALALENETPVLVLNSDKAEKDKHPLLMGYPKDKLVYKDYKLSDIPSVVEIGIDEITQLMDIRFNFFITPKMSRFLDWVSRERMIPKAVFLRRKIEEEMDQSKDFPG